MVARIAVLKQKKERGEKIVATTCYDATCARLLAQCALDVVLVGDSAGSVMLGEPSACQVELAQMMLFTKAVARGLAPFAPGPLLVSDMPFMSYHICHEQTMVAAKKLIQSGARALKMEGASRAVLQATAALTDAGIPVMGHVGYTPQSVSRSASCLRGKDPEDRARLVAQSVALEQAGVFAMVLEMVPASLGKEIAGRIKVPVIGIGAGGDVDGQILVLQDLLGMNTDFQPRFLKTYGSVGAEITQALTCYASEVRSGAFPAPEHCFSHGPSSSQGPSS